MTAVIPLIALVLALVLGVPIAFSLAGAGIFGIWLLTGDWKMTMGIMGSSPFNTVADYSLTTIPAFILMAYFSSSSGLARDLYTAISNWFSRIRGGLAIATVFACGIFGAMSGVSLAAASVMSTIAMPNMRRFGYSESLAAGSIAVGATLDILIPPQCCHGNLWLSNGDLDRQVTHCRSDTWYYSRNNVGAVHSYLGYHQTIPCP